MEERQNERFASEDVMVSLDLLIYLFILKGTGTFYWANGDKYIGEVCNTWISIFLSLSLSLSVVVSLLD